MVGIVVDPWELEDKGGLQLLPGFSFELVELVSVEGFHITDDREDPSDLVCGDHKVGRVLLDHCGAELNWNLTIRFF